MLISYNFGESKLEKNISEKNPQVLLTNKIGGFFSWQDEQSSRYGGFYHKNGNRLFKSIESIKLKDESKIEKINNNFWGFELKRESGVKESYFVPYGFNALVYELNKESAFSLFLDAKEMFDNDEWGRAYSVYEEGGKLIIEFSKSRDSHQNYKFFIVVCSDGFKYKIKKDWVLKDYKYDFLRKDPPFGRYIYSALELEGDKFVFAVSEDKNEALSEAEYILKNLKNLKIDHKNSIIDFEKQHKKNIPKNDIKMAYLSAKFYLSNMLVFDLKGDVEGVYAGIPWFSQYWARDSLISLNALPNNFKKSLFLNYLKEIVQTTKINSCNIGCIESAGSYGWFFKRAEDLISESLLDTQDVFHIKNALTEKIAHLLKENTQDGFAVNGPKETWMDTDYRGDARSGIRIEMQALRLKMYSLAAKLTGARRYFELEHSLTKKVRERFFDGEILKDGIDDLRIRPNVFLAFYSYPELLYKHEWAKVFEHALDNLWLDWGGVATISKDDEMFCGEYRGCFDPDQSYHHGDSWYFLNNMVAMSLFKVDKHKFQKYINAILNASTKEILFSGFLGASAEVSSANKFSSFGCLSQSWSLALYVELIDTLY